jgi:hypothetical protein
VAAAEMAEVREERPDARASGGVRDGGAERDASLRFFYSVRGRKSERGREGPVAVTETPGT